jgi:hypothetical protein
MADKKTPATAEAEAERQADVQAAVQTPDTPTVSKDPRDVRIAKDRGTELERQDDMVKAVHDATRDKDGKPIPIEP